ncbi:hypothetical protein D3C76_1376360 [compost metagenome]
MVRKNSLASDFMTRATLGLSSAWAADNGKARLSEEMTARASRRPGNGSFMNDDSESCVFYRIANVCVDQLW